MNTGQIDWNDLRLFLALARQGSVRAAAQVLGASHSTVARRFEVLERTLGVKLRQRMATGYGLTAEGEQLLEVAEQVEERLDAVQRRVAGKAQQLSGLIRVTLADFLATELLMPDLQAFCVRYPKIELSLQIGYATANLARGEADVALRLTSRPDENCIGRKLGSVAHAAYASRAYVEAHDLNEFSDLCWIGFGAMAQTPGWLQNSRFRQVPVRGHIENLLVQLAATRQGFGLGFLPCLMGDAYPDLLRVDRSEHYPTYDLWLLRHGDTRESARLAAFAEFMSAAVMAHAQRLQGKPDAPVVQQPPSPRRA